MSYIEDKLEFMGFGSEEDNLKMKAKFLVQLADAAAKVEAMVKAEAVKPDEEKVSKFDVKEIGWAENYEHFYAVINCKTKADKVLIEKKLFISKTGIILKRQFGNAPDDQLLYRIFHKYVQREVTAKLKAYKAQYRYANRIEDGYGDCSENEYYSRAAMLTHSLDRLEELCKGKTHDQN